MLPACADHQVGGADIEPGERADAVVVVRPVDEFPVAGDFDPVEIAPRHEVGNARDRVGPVGRGCPVLEHFDPVEREERDQVGVGRTVTRLCGEPAAIEQHQRALAPEAAQVDRTHTLAAARAVLVRIAEHGADGRQALDEFERTIDPARVQLCLAEDIDRLRPVFALAANVGAGDDDGRIGIGLDLLGKHGVSLLFGCGRTLRHRRRGKECGACSACKQLRFTNHVSLPHRRFSGFLWSLL